MLKHINEGLLEVNGDSFAVAYLDTRRAFYHLEENTGALLLFDEGDLFYHPEWQREFVGDILDLVKTCAGEDMQIVFTTNSPFMMSDMLRENIVTLTRGKRDIDEDVLTFGQNIHTLLAHRFFLDSTIGSVSESVIGWLISLLEDPGPITEKNDDLEEKRFYEKMLAYPESRLREIEKHFKENSDYSVTIADLEEALFANTFLILQIILRNQWLKFYEA